MEDLFLRTERGNLPLNPETIRKYNLKKGVASPFSGSMIVDRFGDATMIAPVQKLEPVAEDTPQIMTTSEILDFMQGTDSNDA